MTTGGEINHRFGAPAPYRETAGRTALAGMPFEDLADLAEDPGNAWSIGTFGALGEFVRDDGEAVRIVRTSNRLTIVTARGALRIERGALAGLAWEGLSSDGRGWNHNLALCVRHGEAEPRGVLPLGTDREAARLKDRGGWLFDLGVARGCVRMCIRTRDAALRAMLDGAVGIPLLDRPDLIAAVLGAQPHRVMLSPAGRIEVFQPIPAPHDLSPEGPHTHLLPRLISSGRLHGANDPIPAGWQAALSMHPPPPWSGPRGQRTMAPTHVEAFAPLLARYGTREDAETAQSVIAAIIKHRVPESFGWFGDRRSRAKARIVLRQLAARGRSGVVDAWRRAHDRRGDLALEASRCREVVVWRPHSHTPPPVPAPSAELLRALAAAAGVFREVDREVAEDLRPLLRMGLAALLQARLLAEGDPHVG